MTVEFMNAKKMANDHHASFEVPPDSILDRLAPGWTVKICAGPERFWVTILEISGQQIHGIVSNHLVCTRAHGLRHGDIVVFTRNNIFDVYCGQP